MTKSATGAEAVKMAEAEMNGLLLGLKPPTVF